MSQAISFLQCLLVLLSGLLVVSAAGTVANPHHYGQFAQQEVSKDIPVAFITAKSVKQRLDKGVPQWLVDVRDRSSYDQSHLPDAVSLPLEELPQRFVEIPRDVPVVLYWACPHHLASLAYQYLYRQGYRNMQVLEQGIPGWQQQQYPMQGRVQQSALQWPM